MQSSEDSEDTSSSSDYPVLEEWDEDILKEILDNGQEFGEPENTDGIQDKKGIDKL